MCVCGSDPSLERDADLGLVGDEADGCAHHVSLACLDGVRLDADHLPADLLEGQDLVGEGRGGLLYPVYSVLYHYLITFTVIHCQVFPPKQLWL